MGEPQHRHSPRGWWRWAPLLLHPRVPRRHFLDALPVLALDHFLQRLQRVRVRREGPIVALVLKHLAVPHPVLLCQGSDLLHGVRPPLLLPLEVVVVSRHLLAQEGGGAADDDHAVGAALCVDDVRRLVFLDVRPMPAEHPGLEDPLVLPGEVQHVHEGVAPCDGPGGEGCAAEALRVHRGELRDRHPPVVLVDPEPYELLQLQEPVNLPLGGEAQELQDRVDVLQLFAVVQMDCTVAQLLDGSYDHVCLPVVPRQEKNVADAEACPLVDGHVRPRLVRVHGPVVPGVVAAQLEHALTGTQHVARGYGDDRAIDPPRHHAGHAQVLPPHHEVDFTDVVLHACADVLDRERAHPDDGDILPGEGVVIALVHDAVVDRTPESVLALVLLPLRVRQIPREEEEARHLRGAHVLPLVDADQVVGLLRPHLDNIKLLDVGVESDVRRYSPLVADLLEVVEQLVPRGPRRHALGGVALVRVVEVVGAQLRLDLGPLVRVLQPGGAADPMSSVQHDEIRVLFL
mmetsp:Transcript_65238/g.183636  ORF Transcript_65238/g.183636 Transcript_65238/m.183636 type:complete len:516 (+) Transcript_65238:46-1593(+)